MDELTINQIILLLDIYRGTNTQIKIGTRLKDLKFLVKRGLIDTSSTLIDPDCTPHGNTLVRMIELRITDYLIREKP